MEKENPLVNKFLKQISKIIDHKLEKLTTVESAIVDQVNLDGTVNLHIPPDSTMFTNIQNQSIYQDLQVGDCVKVLKQNNKASNMWIIGGHDLKRSENVEPFKGVDYVVEQGTSGIWHYHKWNSGAVEMFATPMAHGAIDDNQKDSNGKLLSVNTYNLPFALHGDIGCNVNCFSPQGWKIQKVYPKLIGSNNTIDIIMYTETETTVSNVYISIIINASWK